MSWCAESSCRAGAISASIVDDFPSSQIFPTCRLVYIALQGQLMEEEDLAGVPVLVFANKQDLLGAMTGAEIMEALELTSFKDRWVHVEACSAKTGEGLESGMSKLMAAKNGA